MSLLFPSFLGSCFCLFVFSRSAEALPGWFQTIVLQSSRILPCLRHGFTQVFLRVVSRKHHTLLGTDSTFTHSGLNARDPHGFHKSVFTCPSGRPVFWFAIFLLPPGRRQFFSLRNFDMTAIGYDFPLPLRFVQFVDRLFAFVARVAKHDRPEPLRLRPFIGRSVRGSRLMVSLFVFCVTWRLGKYRASALCPAKTSQYLPDFQILDMPLNLPPPLSCFFT